MKVVFTMDLYAQELMYFSDWFSMCDANAEAGKDWNDENLLSFC